MSSTYNPTAVQLGDITIPDDGDDVDAASVNVPFEALADGVEYLGTQSIGYADTTALKAVNTTSLANGTPAHVRGQGWYYLDTGSSATENLPWIVDPTTGPGRWISSTAHQTTVTRITGPGCHALYGTNAGVTPSGTAFTGTWTPITVTDVDTHRGIGVGHARVTTGSAVSWGLKWCIDEDVIDGATLTSATLNYDAAGGHGALPLVMPRFCIYRASKTDVFEGMLSTGDGCAIDGSGSTAVFQAAHDITFIPNQNNVIDRSTYSYFCMFFGEGHTNALVGGIVQGLTLNFTAIPDARRS